MDAADGFGTRLAAVRTRIRGACERAGRDPAAVRLIGVSKTRTVDEIVTAIHAGLVDLGENYAQEAVAKARAFAEAGLAPRWHFLGGLQTNKVRTLVPFVAGIQSIDRPSLVAELARRADPDHPIETYIEVNVGDESQKAGCAPADAADLCRQVLAVPALRLAGLMCVPPVADDPEAARPHFRFLRTLRDDLRRDLRLDDDALAGLSMGMSGDFEAAVEEGATTVRVGTLLFGPRPPRRQES
jgi:pyridoxal phosphate enzyme (YggS family)